MAKQITGTFNYPNLSVSSLGGFTLSPVANGVLILQLSAQGMANGQQVVPTQVSFPLDINGSLTATPAAVFANDEISPAGTTYRMWIKDSGNGQVFGPVVYSLTGASPININALTPVG